MPDIPVPQAIHRGDHEVVITWDPEHRAPYPARYLRLHCHCAECREEMTGAMLLDPGTVPDDITARTLRLVGTYAIRIEWSDGHGTGIYTYQHLRAICPCNRCRPPGAEPSAR